MFPSACLDAQVSHRKIMMETPKFELKSPDWPVSGRESSIHTLGREGSNAFTGWLPWQPAENSRELENILLLMHISQ